MIDPGKGNQHVDGFVGATKAESSPEDRARAARVTRSWCETAGVDPAELLDMLGLHATGDDEAA